LQICDGVGVALWLPWPWPLGGAAKAAGTARAKRLAGEP